MKHLIEFKIKPVMKQFYSLVAAAMISLSALAQLPNGSIAPDFTATDINGNQHNLYALLDSGYQVILDFSATWCGPCWGYHEDGILETLYETYGPEGTNELRVFYLESDDSTDSADLNGTGDATQGDWVTGTTYPIIDDAGDIFDDYLNTYYPTIYTVCPNRILTQSGQIDVAAHASIFQDANCEAASDANDAYLVDYTGETVTCGGSPVSISVRLMNNGLDALTACTITAYDGANSLGSVDWTGSLATYEVEEVEVTSASLTSSTSINIEVTSGDDNVNNNSVSAEVIAAVESTNNVRFTLLCDAYPGEIAWAVFDDMGNAVEQSPTYGAADVGAEYVYNWSLPIGCYTFGISDAFGDGLHSSWYNGTGPDGMFSVDAMDGEEVATTLLSYASPDEYEVLVFPFEVTEISTVEEELSLASTVTMFPNPTQGLSNLQFTTAVAETATLEVINLLGETVMRESFGSLPAGTHRVELNLEDAKAGVYLVNLNAGGQTTTLRFTKQ